MSTYTLLKSLHIIFVICWFAGLFYIGRLFIYINEAKESAVIDQLTIMAKRLWYIITVPSSVLALFSGLGLIFATDALSNPWMHAKMTLLIALFGYHFWCGAIRKKLIKNPNYGSSKKLRIFNEIPTVLLIFIVFLAVTKSLAVVIPVILTILFFGILAMIVSKMLKV